MKEDNKKIMTSSVIVSLNI